MGKVLSIMSGAGGAGKSWFAARLGRRLARGGCSVLLMEPPCAVRALDIELGVASFIVHDIADLLHERAKPYSVIYPCKQAGLSYLPGPVFPDERYYPVGDSLIAPLAQMYDYVIIDVPHGRAGCIADSGAVSDAILLMVTPEQNSCRAAHQIRTLLPHSDIRLIINRYTPAGLEKSDIPDLDACIDITGAQLIGVIPDGGVHPQLAQAAIGNIQGRILGERVPLINLSKI